MKKTSYIILAFWAFLFLLLIGAFLYGASEKIPCNVLAAQLEGDSTMVSRRLPPFRHIVVSVPALDECDIAPIKTCMGFRGELFIAPAERAGRCNAVMEKVACDTLYASEPRLICPRRVMDKLSFTTRGDTLQVALNLRLDTVDLSRAVKLRMQDMEIGEWHLWMTQPLHSVQVDLNLCQVYGYGLRQDSLAWSGMGFLSLLRAEIGVLDVRTSSRQDVSVGDGTHIGHYYAKSPYLMFSDEGEESQVDCEYYSGKESDLHLDGHARHIVWQPK